MKSKIKVSFLSPPEQEKMLEKTSDIAFNLDFKKYLKVITIPKKAKNYLSLKC